MPFISKTELELINMTSAKPKLGEKRRTFIKRLAQEAKRLRSRPWDTLSDAAKCWVNDALESIQEKERVSDFTDLKWR